MVTRTSLVQASSLSPTPSGGKRRQARADCVGCSPPHQWNWLSVFAVGLYARGVSGQNATLVILESALGQVHPESRACPEQVTG